MMHVRPRGLGPPNSPPNTTTHTAKQTGMLRRLAQSCGGSVARRAAAAAAAPTSAPAAAPLSTSTAASASNAGAENLYKYLTPASLLEGKPPSVARALAIENADAKERKQAEKQARIGQFGVRPGDTGSTPVQGA